MEHSGDTIKLRNGSTIRLPKWRGDVPMYRPPDRETWQGATPYELEDVPVKFRSQARAAIARDCSSITFAEAMNAKVSIDEVLIKMEVQGFLPPNPGDQIHFDPETDSFWVYPSPRAKQIA